MWLLIIIGFIIIVCLGAREGFKSAQNSMQPPPQNPHSSEADISEILRKQQLYMAFWDEPIIEEHFKNMEKIETQYSVLYNLKQFNSPQAEQLISLCERDVSIAEELLALYKRYGHEPPYTYDSFKRLAMIYEKRKEFEKAINVCVKAIKVGFVNDGTKGQMHGRLARMIRLSGSDKAVEYFLNR